MIITKSNMSLSLPFYAQQFARIAKAEVVTKRKIVKPAHVVQTNAWAVVTHNS